MAIHATSTNLFVKGEIYDPNETVEADTLDFNTVVELRKKVEKSPSMSSRVLDHTIIRDVGAFMSMATGEMKTNNSPEEKHLLGTHHSTSNSPQRPRPHSPHVLSRLNGFTFTPIDDNPSHQSVSNAVTPVFETFDIYIV